jgi:hypothetical protein
MLLLLVIAFPCFACALGYGYVTKAPEVMARWTLAALIRGDREGVTLLGNVGDEGCREDMQSLYDKHRPVYGNAVVKDVQVETATGTCSAAAVFADITFNYQKPNERSGSKATSG